jgi:membrane-associated phospholipid phosphatase
MSDLIHPQTVSGVPEASLASRRIRPRPGGKSEWLAPKLRRIPSLIVSWLVADVGAALLAAIMIGLGFLTTEVLLHVGAISRADEWFPRWLADHRTASWNHWSDVGSMLGDAPVLVPLAAAVALFLVLRRRWRTASFVVQAGLAEGLAYLLTTLIVARHRPDVVRLDHYNINHSFPSGHVAAALAVYGAVALLLTARFRNLAFRIGIISLWLAIPTIVAFSRMYRGEHHPIDVVAGALMGAGALLVAMFAARTARAVAELREGVRVETSQ